MNEKLQNLYHPAILAHNAEPFHFEKREGAAHVLDASNPLCGDRFRLFFDVENGAVKQVWFHGHGCAISKASTSVLAKSLENQPVEKALKTCRAFLAMFDLEEELPPGLSGDFAAFAAAREFPARLKCAALSWEEMAEWLNSHSAIKETHSSP